MAFTGCGECGARIGDEDRKTVTVTEDRPVPGASESVPVETYECPECGYVEDPDRL